MNNNSLGLRIEKDRVVVSSRDVAKAFDREHKNVLRDIRGLNCSEEFRRLNFELTMQTVAMPKGASREDKFYLMTRDGFVILVMGYTGETAMRFKEEYIREFNRMERYIRDRASLSVPRTLKEALIFAAKLEGEREALEAKNREMAPKAEFYDAVAESPTAIDLGRTAKVLNFIGIGRNSLMEFLRRSHILMPDNTPYQEYVDRGYFKVIEQPYESEDGETHVGTKTVARQTGVNFIRRKLTEAGYFPYEQTRQLSLFPDGEFH
ncbi:MAG: phage regulatory protein/antirepressor Ant [Synergistaceae bacterium]|nr:phage regulatory protein/antirepressor Ant [Synergistaceae bacterium]